jgi:hypothetical protein
MDGQTGGCVDRARQRWLAPATANELQGTRYQGRKIAEAANKLHG